MSKKCLNCVHAIVDDNAPMGWYSVAAVIGCEKDWGNLTEEDLQKWENNKLADDKMVEQCGEYEAADIVDVGEDFSLVVKKAK